MYAYKLAVAIKRAGYSNIRIYNGGLKEWIASGNTVEVIDHLQEYTLPMIDAAELLKKITAAKENGCTSVDGRPFLTLLDLRTERSQAGGNVPLNIASNCTTIEGVMDDLLDEQFRSNIPIDSPVYVITETGNRDRYVGRFLKKYGYTNITGLIFGMRGWIKADYPTN
ncbi:hypothetical protein [Desulfosediminicola flagellatus]|uniref:hypothetical protein n=1 Tax=Desulfosediminicola flagellatus TaxID=2569541 RepID=UPI0010AC8228|nr:hypothetical protein [Desulfosediminicola flagellatus]